MNTTEWRTTFEDRTLLWQINSIKYWKLIFATQFGYVASGNSRLHQASDWSRDKRRGRRLIASSHGCDSRKRRPPSCLGLAVQLVPRWLPGRPSQTTYLPCLGWQPPQRSYRSSCWFLWVYKPSPVPLRCRYSLRKLTLTHEQESFRK